MTSVCTRATVGLLTLFVGVGSHEVARGADPIDVTMRVVDTAGQEISAASVYFYAGGGYQPSGYTHTVQPGPTGVLMQWRNVTPSQAWPNVQADRTARIITPGLTFEYLDTPGQTEIHWVVDVVPVTLGVRDLDGQLLTDAMVYCLEDPVWRPAGHVLDLAAGYNLRLWLTWRNVPGHVNHYIPVRRDEAVALRLPSGDVTFVPLPGEALVDFALDVVPVTIEVYDSAGVHLSAATIYSYTGHPIWSPSRIVVDLAAGYAERVAVNWAPYQPSPYVMVTRDAFTTIQGASPTWSSEECLGPGCPEVVGQTMRFVFPAPDLCPDDPDKLAPGVCGCGVPDTDTDGDGEPDCLDRCVDVPISCDLSPFYLSVMTPTGPGQIACTFDGTALQCANVAGVAVVTSTTQATSCE